MENFQGLLALSKEQLDQAYAQASVAAIPTGPSKGTAIFCPDVSPANRLIAKVAGLFWSGKVFDAQGTSLRNKVIGALRLFKADVYKGESWFDGKESIIIDYSKTSVVCARVRDEIRQVGPGLFLGRAYVRKASDAGFLAVHFALDFN